jgi:hypothetical protein
MRDSLNDVSVTIISQGATQYWAGMKTCGNVFIDIRFGLYSGGLPDLSWIQGTLWEQMLEPLDGPLNSPIYGKITVDFDRRLILDSTGWSDKNWPMMLRFALPTGWTMESVDEDETNSSPMDM